MIIGCDAASKKVALFGIGPQSGPFFHEVKRTHRWHEIRALREETMWALEQWRDYNPVMYIEEPVLAGRRNIRSTILIAETVGMLLSLPVRAYLVPVSTWKKETVGNGAASKEDVANWLSRDFPDYYSQCDGNGDLIDAAAIAVYGSKVVDASRPGALS